MVSAASQLGLLFVVFGGFLASNSTGVASGFGIGAMVLGLCLGVLGVVQSGIPDRTG